MVSCITYMYDTYISGILYIKTVGLGETRSKHAVII